MCPFFSIVIPVYNVAPYLRECLDSVLAQTFGDWEAICVDDGSADGSGAILDEYAARDKRFLVIHQPNGGVSAARNKGLDMAKGEWIGFLDADDIWRPDLLQMSGCDRASDSIDWVRMKGVACYFRDSPPTETVISVTLTTEISEHVSATGFRLVSQDGTPFLNFYRRGCIGTTRFKVGIRFREDALFGFEMAVKAHHILMMDYKGYCRRERSGSAMFSPRRRNDTINLLSAFLDFWERTRNALTSGEERAEMISAITFWVEKDVRQWLLLCPARTFSDAWKVSRIVRRLAKMEAIGYSLETVDRRRLLRWKLYLATGFWWFMVANRRNPFGKPLASQA